MSLEQRTKVFYGGAKSSLPSDILYHYTSLSGVMGIVDKKALWASDIRFLNDAEELTHTSNLLQHEISKRIKQKNCNVKLLNQFRDWLSNRITDGHMLFVTSFTANGNLLSQKQLHQGQYF